MIPRRMTLAEASDLLSVTHSPGLQDMACDGSPGNQGKEMIENIEQLLAHIDEAEGVVGAILVGSSTEDYKDNLSDFDVEIIKGNGEPEPLKCFAEPIRISRRLDLSYVDLGSFLNKRSSPKDVDHWPYQGCRILYDPKGVLHREVAAIIAIDPEVRMQRVCLHFFEFIYYARRFNKLESRPSALNRSMAAAKAVESLIKTLFLAHRRWPPLLHWSEQQLRGLGAPSELLSDVVGLLESPDRATAQRLEASLRSELSRLEGNVLPDDERLVREVTSMRFQAARELYSSF